MTAKAKPPDSPLNEGTRISAPALKLVGFIFAIVVIVFQFTLLYSDTKTKINTTVEKTTANAVRITVNTEKIDNQQSTIERVEGKLDLLIILIKEQKSGK